MKKTGLKLLNIIFILTLLFWCQQSECVQAKEPRIVRVGVYQMPGFMESDSFGNPIGYNVEYLTRIAAHTGWEYEYVEVDNFIEAVDLLRERKIDLLAPVQINKNWLPQLEYCAHSFGTAYTVLLTLEGNDACSYEDFESFEGMRVGVPQSFTQEKQFQEYLVDKNIKMKIRYYDTQEMCVQKMEEGDVDACVVDLRLAEEQHKVLAKVASGPYYYVTWRENDSLLIELNEALMAIKNANPGLEYDLEDIYCPLYKREYFSKEERSFMESVDEVTVAYIAGRIPLSFTDVKTGELEGISRGIFDKISEITGLKFKYVALPQDKINYNFLEKQKYDLITGVEYNSANINSKYLKLSMPYHSSQKVMVAQQSFVYDKNKNYKIAVATGSATLLLDLKEQYPNLTQVEYEDVTACFEAVRRGETDLLLYNQHVAEYMLSKPKFEALHIIPDEGLEDSLCFAAVLREDADAEEQAMLISVLNKAISQIAEEELESIILKKTSDYRYTFTAEDFCYKYRYALILFVVLVGVVCLFFVTTISNLRRESIRLLQEEERNLIQQRRYQILMDESQEMMFEINLVGEKGFVSDKIEKKFGWTIPDWIPDDHVGEHDLAKIWNVHPKDKKALEQFYLRVAGEKEAHEVNVRIPKADGEYIWCRVLGVPLLSQHNSVISILGKIEDVDEEVKEKEKLELQSRIDTMTDLLNKRAFMEEVDKYLMLHPSKDTALIFMDLDHFKMVNDLLGHSAGDRAIRDAAKKLQVIFANCDLVSRFGGDEFCVFVKNIPLQTLEEKLSWAVGKMQEKYREGDVEVTVTASIGAVYCMVDRVGYQSMLDFADEAMYEAKANGRNCYVLKKRNQNMITIS